MRAEKGWPFGGPHWSVLATNRHVFICDTAPIKMNEPFWLCCYAGITYHVAFLYYFPHTQPSPAFR
jgi:hypothetical protein